MKKIITTMIAMTLAMSTTVMAEGLKIGAGYMMLNSEIEGIDFDTSAIGISLANAVTPNVDIEGVLAFGISDDTYSDYDPFLLGDFTVTGELSTMLGVFAKVHSDSMSGFEVFGRLGLARVEYDVDLKTKNFGSGSESYDDTGLAYGFGASYNFTEKSAIVVDYSFFPDIDFEGTDIETDVITIGFQISL